MTNEECFGVWAPELNPWSRWAKPALFCGSPTSPFTPTPGPVEPIDLSWVENARSRTAAIVDLPGAEAVRAGLELALRGYRPVPLFNTSVGPSPLIDAGAIVSALMAGAEQLREISMPPDAPPAFLLDSDRTRPTMTPVPGRYDNRWIVF